MNTLKQLKQRVHKAVKDAGFTVEMDEVDLTRAKGLEHGHFATNIAMLIAGKFGKNPREVGEAIAERLREAGDTPFTKVEVAGPGFINLWIEQKFYSTICGSMAGDLKKVIQGELEGDDAGRTLVIEYSSPNIAKPLGAHHLLSTVIGESLKHIEKKVGWKVIAENYPGDIGTQFGKLIVAIRKWGDETLLDQAEKPVDLLLELYVRFHNEAEKNASLDEEARAEYKRFEEGDPEARKTWQKIVGWTWNEIRPLYERLGVSFDAVHGESFFEERMKGVLEKGRQKGVFVDGENGAWIVLPEDPNDPPALVRKSDGTSLYLTRDLAQMEFFEQEYHPDAMLWPVDSAQKLHFRQRFAAARKLGITNARLVHAEFGRMNFKDGGMSTRKGNIVRMEAVLDEAEKRSLELIRSKGAELTEEEQKALAVQMGANAVKYNILSQNRLSDITFDWNTMLAMEGNSAPYLMYTVARARSVLRKAGMEAEKTARFELTMTDDHETRLMLTLMGYAEAVRRSAEEFKPNHIANHLYQLAQDFNSFYNALPILKAEKLQRESRLLLTAATLNVMEDAFGLLVMAPPDKM